MYSQLSINRGSQRGQMIIINLINGNYDDDSFDTINVNYILIQSLTDVLL